MNYFESTKQTEEIDIIDDKDVLLLDSSLLMLLSLSLPDLDASFALKLYLRFWLAKPIFKYIGPYRSLRRYCILI